MLKSPLKYDYAIKPVIYHKTGRGKNMPDPAEWLIFGELSVLEELKFKKRREEWLLGRWTMKNLIKEIYDGQYNPIEFKNIEIRRLPKAAPELFIDGKSANLRISLSHRSGKCFCIAWENSFSAGCDLEKIEPRSQPFINDYFSKKERNFIKNSDNEPLFANLFWSLKESVLKANKSGLQVHPTQVEIYIELPWNHHSWNKAYATLKNVPYNGYWKAKKGFVRTIMGDKIHKIS